MKFVSAILTISMASSASASLANSSFWKEDNGPFYRMCPGNLTVGDACSPEETFRTEYVVVQYGKDIINRTCLDGDNAKDQKIIADAFFQAYTDENKKNCESAQSANLKCTIINSTFVAHDELSSTFLLQTNSTCNQGSYYKDEMECGIDLFEAPYALVSWPAEQVVEAIQDIVPGGRRLDGHVDPTCDCTMPTSVGVLKRYNEYLNGVLDLLKNETCNLTEAVAWGTAVEQSCPVECSPDDEDISYNIMGVKLPCLEAPSEYPSEYPSEFPSEYPSEYPSEEPSGSSEPIGEVPSSSPTGSSKPTGTPSTSGPTGSSSPTGSPTTSPSANPSAAGSPSANPSDANSPTTGSPSTSPAATGSPTTSPTGSPTTSPAAAGTPTTSPTGSPTTSPAGTPTTSPTGSPTVAPVPAPDPDTETPTVAPVPAPDPDTETPTVAPVPAPDPDTETPTVAPVVAPTTA